MQTAVLGLPAANEQQPGAEHYRPNARPDRAVHRLLLFHRHLDRANLRLMGLLSVSKTTVHQAQDAGRDQRKSSDLKRVHSISSSSFRLVFRSLVNRPAMNDVLGRPESG